MRKKVQRQWSEDGGRDRWEDKVLTVDNPQALEGHEGQHVAVTGKIRGYSIHVASVNPL